jgi:hypothetical protein
MGAFFGTRVCDVVRWIAAALMAAWVSTAHAEPKMNCGDRELTIQELTKAGEVLKFRGYSVQFKILVEIYAAPRGSWTLLVTSAEKSDTVCIGDYGQGGFIPPVKKIGIEI